MAGYYRTADTVWPTWSSGTSTTSCVEQSGSYIWVRWQNVAQEGTIEVDTSGGTVWRNWAFDCTASTSATTTPCDNVWRTFVVRDTVRQATAEEAEASRKQQEKIIADNKKKAEEAKKLRDAAELKAKDLLLDLIGTEQMKVYEETGRIFVKGKKHDYILRKGSTVMKIEKDSVSDMCVHLANRHTMPEEDNMVALKLALENEEGKVLKMANIHRSYDRPQELPRAACM